ncbi:uncharacterized protein EV420DRAFT_1733408 [Desarmillaria tabescens]|uniref:Heterokaryon incompatibility domain-containing protein n=1 Tax=Armillaria tabescens TaxID=1929756 RepID=A0AA39MN98_ARMTA|nr:uncharacterized protein EV420DRAFT_1733408 [Desarmillaria tabescens]KAK0439954.1 hypothetical protein EV420DRAFT_1733408 [Desarmillaria tabescens]
MHDILTPIHIVEGRTKEEEWLGGGSKSAELRDLTMENYEKLPKVTLSALTETGQAESNIPVPKQRSHTGRKLVIRSALANTPCVDLGINGILKELNAKLKTLYTLDDFILRSALESFISHNYDFGNVYAILRPYWGDLTSFKHIYKASNRDRKMRKNMIINNRVSERRAPPRRVWDLYANRVVPLWVADEPRLCAISHAWVSDEERKDVWTPINGYEWPVPIPKDADLNLIRIEMLNLGAEYVWLDVLCLRQAGGQREDLRREEWKVDVPTIGAIYRNTERMMVYYLSGLGRPFCLKAEDLESDRCWFRRAWTLQEVSVEYIIAGHATWSWTGKPLDRVAGLAYLLSLKSIPLYHETQSEEDAWGALVDVMSVRHHTDFLFFYPEPGDGHKRWRPSWNQVMAMEDLPKSCSILESGVLGTGDAGADCCEGPCIKLAEVLGLATASNKLKHRRGELVVKDSNGTPHTFKIVADHAYPIPDGSYSFIGNPTSAYEVPEHWVVGRQRYDGKFEKVSVIRMEDLDQHQNLSPFHDAQVYDKILLC